MLIPRPNDALHKAMLYRVLIGVADDNILADVLRFKGGTCAAMMAYLNRFSVDLDFNFIGSIKDAAATRNRLGALVKKLGFEIHDYSKTGIQFFLKYKSPPGKRNTLKVDAVFPAPHNSLWTAFYFSEIDRTLGCHAIEDIFANKLVAVFDRYEKHGSVAGRDVYDIHAFFSQELEYEPLIIEERRGGVKLKTFFKELAAFIKKHFTETILNQDLNMLLPEKEFQRVRKILIPETLRFLEDEARALEAIN